jgi:hypothetical protein
MSAGSGTSQAQRMPAALAPHYVDVDELSFPQLLVVALDAARHVAFEGGAPGTGWDIYFKKNEVFVMADILSAGAAPLDPAAGAALTWPQRLQAWSEALSTSGSAHGVDLRHVIDGLLAKAGGASAAGPDTHPGGAHGLPEAVAIVQRAAARHLPQALRSGVHDPAVAMLIAFAQLYRRAQEKLNRFTERHQDFYYTEVLRARARGATSDATVVVFEAASAGVMIPIAAGTRFLAPCDGGAPDLEYVTEYPLAVTDARVVALHTVYFERNRLAMPESRLMYDGGAGQRCYPGACHLNRLAVASPAPQRQVRRDLEPVAMPLFGAPRARDARPPGVSARIGFALASDVLLMGDGRRTVTVALHLGRRPSERGSGARSLGERMEQARQVHAGHTAAESDAGQPQWREHVLRRLFKVAVSGAAGWIPIPWYEASLTTGPRDGDVLELRFALAADAAAVTPYMPAVHGDCYATTCPLLRFELNADADVYGYGLLRELTLRHALIDVEVRDHRALALQNQDGPLSAAAAFQPFGALPVAGDYLIVGSAEAARKTLSHCELAFEWARLPSAPGGWGDYYATYGDAGPWLAASPFVDVGVSLGVLSGGAWTPPGTRAAPAGASAILFGAGRSPADVPLCAPTVTFDGLLGRAPAMAGAEAAARFAYAPGVRGGFFKLTLCGADFMLGHARYPYVLADALSYNNQPRHRARLRALPAPPYTPLLGAISMHYRASATITSAPNAAGDAFFRSSPLGWQAAHGGGADADLLLPRFEEAGNLYIGVAATSMRAPLTLFFHLREDALPLAEPSERQLRWAYLSDNEWRYLAPHAVRADATHGFLRAGVVTLTLPPEIDSANTDLPAGVFWLRVSCDDHLDGFCGLYSVSAHAARVVRDLAVAGAPHAPATIAANTITRPRQTIPGLGRVFQMTRSSGGAPAESVHDMRRRTAEQLRHKGQAITADDYERIVLQRFPDIDRVKCFANSSLRSGGARPRPGHVLIVGLPAFRSSGHVDDLPRLDGYLVGQVREFLQARVAPSVTLEVANPEYQFIRVCCSVTLRAGADPGQCVNELDDLISDFISPWSRTGNTSHFGWQIRRHDIESFILAHAGVLAVSGFSMQSVSERDLDHFDLSDTATVPRPGGDTARADAAIVPARPWSVAVPAKRHRIEVRDDGVAAPIGIGEMEIGNTFIIGGNP